MKIMVYRSPRFLSAILRLVFGMGKNEPNS
ncbi:MAG: stage V sporulation protein SpoVM [Clostridiales bacterium]|nr:stage V sporulation protein SpoVM [Clostridiales bacterium]